MFTGSETGVDSGQSGRKAFDWEDLCNPCKRRTKDIKMKMMMMNASVRNDFLV
jgi:hypothetical protein